MSILLFSKPSNSQAASKECELPEIDKSYSCTSVQAEYTHTGEGGDHTLMNIHLLQIYDKEF